MSQGSKPFRPTDLVDSNQLPIFHDLERSSTSFSVGQFRKLFEKQGFVYPKRALSFDSFDDTRDTLMLQANFAIRASQFGARVLIVEVDPRALLTRYFQATAQGYPVVVDLLQRGEPAPFPVATLTEGLDLLPSDRRNARLAPYFSSDRDGIRTALEQAIAGRRSQYDIVLYSLPTEFGGAKHLALWSADATLFVLDLSSLKQTKFVEELQRTAQTWAPNPPGNFRVLLTCDGVSAELAAQPLGDVVPGLFRERMFPILFNVDKLTSLNASDGKTLLHPYPHWERYEDLEWLVKEVLGIHAWQDKKIKGQV